MVKDGCRSYGIFDDNVKTEYANGCLNVIDNVINEDEKE